MSADLVIAHGIVANADGRRNAHVVVEKGRIVAVLDVADPVPAAARTIDATGLVVMPGGVDGHCHIAQTTGPYSTLDDYALTTSAALWGGTTTVLDFGIPRDRSETPLAAALGKLEAAGAARCDVVVHGSVVDWDETVPGQLEELAARGIRSVKLYTTNRGTTKADGDTILRTLREMARLDGLAYVHAEHDEIVVDCTQLHADAGEISIEHLPATRPELAEEASVREVLAVARYTGAGVYFVHQSTPVAVDLVTAARMEGQAAFSETCPHYVALDSSVYNGPLPEFYACCPPMRDPETVADLRSRLLGGAVDTVASDHSCYSLEQKREHADDIRQMPHGLPGVETRLPVTFTQMVAEDLSGLEAFVSVFAAAPARLNGLRGKGAIAPGYDADLVLVDPAAERAVDGSALHMGTDFSPFEGLALRGWAETVVAAGRVVVDAAGFHDPGPAGRVLEQAKLSEALAWGPLGAPATPIPTSAFAGRTIP